MSDDAKRAALNIRTTTALKERLQAAGEASGRTMSQEADLRLEQSFARDDAAGSRAASVLGDVARLAATITESQTGKSWTDDPDTYFRVRKAVLGFMVANHPPDRPAYSTELTEALAELEAAKAEVERVRPSHMNALLGTFSPPETNAALQKMTEALERLTAAQAHYTEITEANNKAGAEVATDLNAIFTLRPKAASKEQDAAETPQGKATRKRTGSLSNKPMPRTTRVQKRAEPHSTRQRA